MIISVCSWRTGEMLDVYRNFYLLDSQFGAHYQKAHRFRQRKRKAQGASPELPNLANVILEQKPLVANSKIVLISDSEEKKLKQSKLKLIPLKKAASTQTEPSACKCKCAGLPQRTSEPERILSWKEARKTRQSQPSTSRTLDWVLN
jgi:hypothetical protein